MITELLRAKQQNKKITRFYGYLLMENHSSLKVKNKKHTYNI